ncbi:MAG: hypothetical protein H6719_14825 [Sandaracinaceae bacterium]|nr:hypothetical protein [Sandaracinaceae bacterium]
MRRTALSALLLIACGTEAAPSPPPEAPPEPPPEAVVDDDVEPPEEPPAEAPAEVVDLLHAVPTTVVVSTALGDAPQLDALWDGDLSSRWCSGSGQLAGSWMEVSVPAGATVDHLLLTNGDTSGAAYRATHRIRRVRVTRNGQEIGTFPLDPEDMTLQRVPASGEGGTWRIEVVDVVPGSAASQSVCVSELRVMGTAPGQAEGAQPTGRVSATAAEAYGAEADLVDLLHAVPTTIRASSDEDDDPEGIARIADGERATVWSSRTGDRVGAFLEVVLPQDATLARVELDPGLGAELPIRRVRVTHDGIPFGEHDLVFAPSQPPSIAVMGSGGTWRFEVLRLDDAGDAISVAEMRVLGHHPDEAPGTEEPTTELAEPSEDTAAAGLALATDPAQGAVFGTAEGLTVTELSLGSGVEERQIVDARSTFSRASDERVYCLVRLDNPEREASGISMTWEATDAEGDAAPARLMNVPAQPRYVTFGFSGTRRRAGRYRCVIRTPSGELLGSAAFDLTE